MLSLIPQALTLKDNKAVHIILYIDIEKHYVNDAILPCLNLLKEQQNVSLEQPHNLLLYIRATKLDETSLSRRIFQKNAEILNLNKFSSVFKYFKFNFHIAARVEPLELVNLTTRKKSAQVHSYDLCLPYSLVITSFKKSGGKQSSSL